MATTDEATLRALTEDELLDGYSDCYKSLYNVRPHYNPGREALISFWLGYDAAFAQSQEEEREQDEMIAEHHRYEEATRQEEVELQAVAKDAQKAYQMGVPWSMMEGWY